MNFRLFGDKWTQYYKRGFLLSFFIISFMCVIDQILNTPLFFSKISNLSIFLFTISTIFFASVFCGLLGMVYLLFVSLVSKKD